MRPLLDRIQKGEIDPSTPLFPEGSVFREE
jgi:hypothetical protein